MRAVRAMLVASSCHHILSDNALFNTKVMTRFWSQADTVIHPDYIATHREDRQMAGHDMVTALRCYETLWQELRSDSRSLSVLNSLEERKSTTAECPHVASVLDSLDAETLHWLTQKYLSEDVSQYGPSGDGYTRLAPNMAHD